MKNKALVYQYISIGAIIIGGSALFSAAISYTRRKRHEDEIKKTVDEQLAQNTSSIWGSQSVVRGTVSSSGCVPKCEGRCVCREDASGNRRCMDNIGYGWFDCGATRETK